MRFIIDAALDFLPHGARLCEDQIRWSRTGFFNRMETLPVDFGDGDGNGRASAPPGSGQRPDTQSQTPAPQLFLAV